MIKLKEKNEKFARKNKQLYHELLDNQLKQKNKIIEKRNKQKNKSNLNNYDNTIFQHFHNNKNTNANMETEYNFDDNFIFLF